MPSLSRTLLSAAALLALAASSMAAPPASFESGESDPHGAFTSQRSRAQVAAELSHARAQGHAMVSGEAIEGETFASFRAERTRADVRAEAIEARRLGLTDEIERQMR